MKPEKLRLLVSSALLAGLALACATFASPTPTPTAVPPTATVTPTPTPDYAAMIEEGWAAFGEENVQKASEIVGEVLAQDTSVASAWALSGAIDAYNAEYDAAIEDLERALAIDNGDERTIKTLISVYQLRASELIVFVNTTYDPDAIIEAIREGRGIVDELKDLGDSSEVTTVYFELYNRDPDYGIDPNIPDDAYDHFEEAEAYFRNDQYDQAIKEYQNAIDDYPEFAVAYLYLGDTYYVQGEYEPAIEYMREAVEINPQLVSGWSFLGDAYTELGLAEHAHEAFLKALYLDIDNEIAYNGLGRIDNFLGHWKNDYFLPYEFVFYFDPSSKTSVAAREVLGEPDVEQGAIRIDGADQLILILWQPWGGEKINEESGSVFIEALSESDPATTLVGDTFEFVYNDASMVVQLYDYDAPDDDVERNGATVLASCGSRLFVMQFEYAEEDINDLIVFIAPYLESFRCDVE